LAEVSTDQLRQRILKDRGLVPPKPRKVKLPITQPEEDITLMENIPLLPKMKYIEAKYNIKVKNDIFVGSLNDVVRRYNWDIDRSTVSRWRKYMKRFLMEAIR